MKRIVRSALRHSGYEIRAISKPDRYSYFDETETHDYEQLKPFLDRAARFTAYSEQADAIRNLYFTGIWKDHSSGQLAKIEIGDRNTTALGVWRRQSPDKRAPFIRDPARKSEWLYWADYERIEPKQSRWRVVLLGEFLLARGYFYDPQLSVTQVVQAMLDSELGRKNIDVVDLAKTNLRMEELKTCIGQSLALSPDIVVIFAGNNWHPHLSESDIPYVEALMRREGVPGLKTYLDEKRLHATQRLLDQTNELLASRNVKIVWVIPDTNLKDWVDPTAVAPVLPGDGNRIWCELDRQLTRATNDKNFAFAERLAKQMHGLDGGTSSIPLHILAECSDARGDVAATRRYLEMCRDAVGWDPTFSYCPRVFSAIQKGLRGASARPGNAVVDLPKVFDANLGSDLPGKRLFLDYCHMATEGIAIAAAEIASHVLTFTAGLSIPSSKLLNQTPLAAGKIEGKACLAAAAHNATYYQHVELVKYWCDRALEHWPECAQLMIRFADYATRDLPIAMCKSGLELAELDELNVRRLLLHGRLRRLDLTFGDAAVSSLANIGINIATEISELRRNEHSPRNGVIELTEFFYSAAIPALSGRCWTSRALPTNHGSQSIYASAFWEKSHFVFIAERGQTLTITLACRVRDCSESGGTVTLDVNGHHIAELPAGRSWHTHTELVPNEFIVEGLNHISISWPNEDFSSDTLLTEIANDLVAMRVPYLYRVFGEIHSLSIEDAGSGMI